MNKELINKITILKKEVEYSKNEMRKKDEKLLKYLNRFDKIASENAYNNAEILNLEEELMNRKNEMDIKNKKINELMNINFGLEKEMNQLKTYYKAKGSNNNTIKNIKSINRENNFNENNMEKDNNKINENEDINNNQYSDKKCEAENKNKENFEELSVDELHSRRNSLIKERNEITVLYNKLPIKIESKEQMRQKIDLENKLTRINNDLMKIRLQLKNYNNQ